MFPIRKLEVTYKDINDIVPYAGNVKKHPEEQLGRHAFLMESDPRYVDVIVRRWEELTGERAVRL